MNEPVINPAVKNPVDLRLRRIADVLLLNGSFTDNPGLLNGKMGIAIFLYRYARSTGNEMYGTYAGELIDEIYEAISTQTPVDFANGLTGIGWGIEYLVKNGFVEADTDEALAELDNTVYKSNLDQSLLFDNINGLSGYGFYYISRLRGRVNDDDNQNIIFIKQQLKYLTEACESLLVQKLYPGSDIKKISTETINSIIWFLLEIHMLGLSPGDVEKVFHRLPEYIESGLQSSDDGPGQSLLLRLTENIISSVANTDLQKKLCTILKKKKGQIFDTDSSEDVMVNNFTKKTWQQLVYKPYLTKAKLLQDPAGKIFSIIDDEANWAKRLDKLNKYNMGLTGLAGLGFGLLFERMKKELLKVCSASN